MFIFSKAFPLLEKGYRIRHKKWPDLYFITLNNNQVFDSQGNLFIEDYIKFLEEQKETSDAAGHMWEIFYEVTDENL